MPKFYGHQMAWFAWNGFWNMEHVEYCVYFFCTHRVQPLTDA